MARDIRKTSLPLREELPLLMRDHNLTVRAAATRIEMNFSYLGQVMGGHRPPSRKLLDKLTELFVLPPDYFLERRAEIVIELMKEDPSLVDRFYDLARHRHKGS